MKRVILAMLLVLGLFAADRFTALGFVPANEDRLPDYDLRHQAALRHQPLDNLQQQGLDRLQERLPHLKISPSDLLGAPRFVRSDRGFLTGPNGAGPAIAPQALELLDLNDPHRVVKAFVLEHSALFGHGPDVLEAADVSRDFVTAHNGLRTTVWWQQLDGVRVFEAVFIAHLTQKGELVSLSSQFLPDPAAAADAALPNRAAALAAPAVSGLQALIQAAAEVGVTLAPDQVSLIPGPDLGPDQQQKFSAPTLPGESEVRLVWLPYHRGLMRLSWQVILTRQLRGEMFMVLVDAQSGDAVLRRNLTEYISDATYNVYTSDSPSPFSPGHPTPNAAQPALVNRIMVTTPAINTNASPNGWINDGDNETRGNNVDAHLDLDANNQPDLPRPQGNPNRVFDFPLDLTMGPDTYRDAAVVQLFYLNNWIHDKLYELGFTEAAGNFQATNFNRGGLGNDPVQADAQDGSGVNNANFATPPDGTSGRMQMYLFNGPSPDRDGDLDAEIVIHEYGHGLSNRRVGNGVGISTLQPRGMGEGWSDWYALTLLSESSDDVDATYAAGGYATYNLGGLQQNYYFGIRRYPYSTDLNKNPLTFKDIDPTQASNHPGIPRSPIIGNAAAEVHNQGEVWCVTLWEARANLIKKFGYATGNQLILQLVTDGMNLSPPNPNFLEARDAIIQADLVNNGGANFDELWIAFAKRGMGGSASSPPSTTTTGVEEAYDLPGLALRSHIATDPSGNGNGAVDYNECLDLDVVLINNGRISADNVFATLTTTNTLVAISQGASPYPNIPPGATATNAIPFKFHTKPEFPCGSSIVFDLVVTNSLDVRTIRVIVETGLLGPTVRFDNNTPLPIPDANPVGVSSPINVSGFANAIGKVVVSLHLNHTFVFDLDIRLVAPDGSSVILAQQIPSAGDDFGIACAPDTSRTTFDDKGTTPIGAGRPPFVGIFRPDEPLAGFKGKSGQAVNGIWRLHITDIFAQDLGTNQCWSLQLSPILCADGGGDCSTDVGISITNSPAPNVVGSNLTYTITVTNLGPNTARSVTVTDPLPPNTTFVSALASQGTCGELGGIVTCNLGTIADQRFATVSLVVQPTLVGFLTNSVSVTSTVSDPNPTNNTATIVTRITPPAPVIVPAGTFLVSESLAPPNGGLDIGELVTIDFSLRNVGSLDSSNLVVKLQSGGGVTSPSVQQSYGVLVVGGPSVRRPFTFTATGTNGGAVTATLQLQDGTNNLGSLVYTFALGSRFSLVNQSVLNFPSQGPVNIYPSPIFVSGLLGVVDKLQLTLSNISHTFPADIDTLLVGPSGAKAVVMSDAGGSLSINNVTVELRDDAAAPLPFSSAIVAGAYRPADYQPGDVFPAPAPAGPYAAVLDAFQGSNPNGTWLLYVTDDTEGDSGRIGGGWHLHITTVDPVNPEADLGLSVIDQPDPIQAGQNLTYTISLTNRGPEEAFGVRLTNTLPAGLDFVSASGTQGSCTLAGNQVVCDLGAFPPGAAATVNLVTTPNQGGSLTLLSTVFAEIVDFLPEDNTVSTTTTVLSAADLALSMTAPASPTAINVPVSFHLAVTNQGPNTAFGVNVTNTLPAGLSFMSATPSLGTCTETSGRVVCSLGTLSAGAGATIQLMVNPTQVATVTNRANLRALTPLDPNPTNNSAQASLAVVNPQFLMVNSGAALVAESFTPPNGGIERNEIVEVDFGIRNIGTSDTANLTATLLNSGGVTNSSGSALYGVVPAGGSPVFRRFTFSANGAPGSLLTANLRLQDGPLDLGTLSYSFAIGAVSSFANTNSIAIPDVGKANPYPSIITVSNLSGLVAKASVSLLRLHHSYPDDLDVLLVAPSGASVLLQSDVGGANGVTNLDLALDDDGAGMPDFSPLGSGPYRPTNFETLDLFPAPAPTAPYGDVLAALANTPAAGAWSLYVVDDSVGDLGAIEGGWTLDLTTFGPVNSQPADLSEPASLADGRFQFTLNGQAGATYLIQTSSDFMTWTTLTTRTLGSASEVVTDDAAPGSNVRFYRALLVQ